MGGEPIGRSVSAALSSRSGRWLVYAVVLFWTIPTFGMLVSSFRPELDVKTTGWWEIFRDPNFTLDNYETVLASAPGSDNLTALLLQLVQDHDSVGDPLDRHRHARRLRVLVDEVQGS